MKYNNFFRFFKLLFVLFVFSIPAFVSAEELNTISRITVEHPIDNKYNLSLFFNEKFNGRAFIQEKETGSYLVFIQDTTVNKDSIKIGYKNKKDKSKIKIQIEDKPIIKNNKQSNYVKLTVNTKDGYSIGLLANTINDIPIKKSNKLNVFSLILISLFAFLIFGIKKLMKNTNNNNQSYTAFPSKYKDMNKEFSSIPNSSDSTKEKETLFHTAVLEKVNLKKTLKTIDNNSFNCFNFPEPEKTENTQKQSNIEFKSTLNQTSKLLKEKTVKSKISNPIKSSKEDLSELKLPLVKEIEKNKQIKEQTEGPELLSELHITPTKGFYLTTVDDTFALFGFVGEKVYLLKKFNDLSQINLQARFYDSHANNDMYIVRLDSYKAMVEISDTGMKELAVL